MEKGEIIFHLIIPAIIASLTGIFALYIVKLSEIILKSIA
jgi:hypothetical protein